MRFPWDKDKEKQVSNSCESRKHTPPQHILENVKMGKVYRHRCPVCKKVTLFSKPLYTIDLDETK